MGLGVVKEALSTVALVTIQDDADARVRAGTAGGAGNNLDLDVSGRRRRDLPRISRGQHAR